MLIYTTNSSLPQQVIKLIPFVLSIATFSSLQRPLRHFAFVVCKNRKNVCIRWIPLVTKYTSLSLLITAERPSVNPAHGIRAEAAENRGLQRTSPSGMMPFASRFAFLQRGNRRTFRGWRGLHHFPVHHLPFCTSRAHLDCS